MGEAEVQAASETIRSNALNSRSNTVVRSFEECVAEAQGVNYCVAVSSGTSALMLALAAAGVKPGDEVIVPSYTFVATASQVSALGAKPIFADIDPSTLCIDPNSVGQLITSRTAALIGVHLNGHPADVIKLRKLCQSQAIAFIEDAAQAQGAKYGGAHVGQFGTATVLSFWEGKMITTAGEGGAVLTDDRLIYDRVRLLMDHAEVLDPSSGHSRHVAIGYNFRMTAMQASVGLVQMDKLLDFVDKRREIAELYRLAFSGRDGLRPIGEVSPARSVYWKYPLRLDLNESSLPVDYIVACIKAEGVPIARRYPTPLHMQPIFKKTGQPSLPVTETAAASVLALPTAPSLSRQDVADCINAIEKVLDGLGIAFGEQL
jgi:perosamine synthetase